jgi:hypothetical protein
LLFLFKSNESRFFDVFHLIIQNLVSWWLSNTNFVLIFLLFYPLDKILYSQVNFNLFKSTMRNHHIISKKWQHLIPLYHSTRITQRSHDVIAD